MTPLPSDSQLRVNQRRQGPDGEVKIIRIQGDAVLVREPSGKSVYRYDQVAAMSLIGEQA